MLLLRDGFFRIIYDAETPKGWFHLVFNYIGPEDGEGTRVYYNGRKVASSFEKVGYNTLGIGIKEGDGRIAIERIYTGSSSTSGSHEVDELFLFNQALTDEEIERLNSKNAKVCVFWWSLLAVSVAR